MMQADIAKARAELAATFKTMDALFDFAEALILENRQLRSVTAEYTAVIERQRGTILRQAKLIGSTPSSQLFLHGDPLARRGRGEDEGCSD